MTLQVFEQDRSPAYTGLVDQFGNHIMSVPETVPFGFRGK